MIGRRCPVEPGVTSIQLIIGSTRPARFADKPAAWIVDRLTARDDLKLDVVDLRDYPLPFYDADRSPAFTQRDYATPELAAWGRRLDLADGYIVLAAEYNHGYTAVLKNALDVVFPELNRKPIAFVGYGSVGGARAVEQLRSVAIEMEMAPLRHAVHILPEVFSVARAAELGDVDAFAPLDARLARLADDLVWWSEALAAARAAG